MNDSKASDVKAAAWLAVFGEPTRLKIVRILATGSKSVNEIAKACRTEVVNVSHHLGVMRASGVATCEKSGRQHVHRLANAKVVDGCLVIESEGGLAVSVVLPLLVVDVEGEGEGGEAKAA